MSLFNFSKKQPNIPKRRLSGDVSRMRMPAATPSGVFRRNRTLTGTTSNHLDSVSAKSDLESTRTRVHHLTIQRRKIGSIFSIILLASILIWTLVNNFTATTVVSVSDTNISRHVNASTYEKVIQDYLDGNPISRLSFLIDQVSLTTYVTSKLPEVKNIVTRGSAGVGATNFVITMRTPVAGWKLNDKQYYVDSEGMPFEQNYFSAPSVQIVDDSGISLQAGTTAIASKRFLSFVGRVVSLSKANGYTVIQAILPSGTTRELEVKLKESSSLVKLSIDRPAGEQVEDMARAIRYFASHSQSPQYIDIRVSGKAFYR